MNCGEAEHLFDAHLDGELSGTLRLEFDAHRLRCSHCQQTLAMLESCGHLIATDRRGPSLSDGFADRVMGQIAQRQAERSKVYKLRFRKVGLVAAGVMQAAALLMLAVVLRNSDSPTPVVDDGTPIVVNNVRTPAVAGSPDPGALLREVYDKVGRGLERTTDARQYAALAPYLLNIVPEAMARAAADENAGSFMNILQRSVLGAPAASEAESAEESSRFAL